MATPADTDADAQPSTHHNPFAASEAAAVDGDRALRPSLRPRGWMIGWTVVYGINLIVPLLFVSGSMMGWGAIGIFAAIVVMWLLSLWLCARSPLLRSWLTAGGLAVGASQVVPALQIMAGLFGVTAAGWILRLAGQPIDLDPARALGTTNSNIGMSFLTTVFTGSALMVASLAAGFVLVGLGRLLMRGKGGEPGVP